MRPARIVVIDHNPADVLLLEMALREHGIHDSLIRFESGAEAVRVLCAADLDWMPDAILLDLNTPRTDGFEALRQLMECPGLSKVPIAVLTSSRDRKDRHRAELEGARYIEKPSELNEFLTTVGQAVKEMLDVGRGK
jgi:CheY-like chemotaxis protein